MYGPAQIAVAAILLLNLVLVADELIPARWGVLGSEAVLLAALVATAPRDPRVESKLHRRLMGTLSVLLAVANSIALLRLAHFLVTGGETDGRTLILSGVVVWLTNVVLFGLLFWYIDGGGPQHRALTGYRTPDFLFPQSPGDEPGEGTGARSSITSTSRAPTPCR